jgi:hypothetical protein
VDRQRNCLRSWPQEARPVPPNGVAANGKPLSTLQTQSLSAPCETDSPLSTTDVRHVVNHGRSRPLVAQ